MLNYEMMKTFLSHARNQIDGVIPANSEVNYFLGLEIEDVAFAAYLFSVENENEYKMGCILAFPSKMNIDSTFKTEFLKFRNILEEQGCLLIIVYEEQSKGGRNSLGDYFSEEAYQFSPNYVVLPSYSQENFKTTIDGFRYLTIRKIIEYILTGQIVFAAPLTGMSQVNIEMMTDTCSDCKKAIKTVNGIVFPDSQSENWDNDKWKYYNTLIPASSMNVRHAKKLRFDVSRLMNRDQALTPVVFHVGTDRDKCYWTAACPYCKTSISPYYIEDKRMELLHDLDSRINHQLEYKTMSLDVDQELLNHLADSVEYNPYSCFAGWKKINIKK